MKQSQSHPNQLWKRLVLGSLVMLVIGVALSTIAASASAHDRIPQSRLSGVAP